MEEISLSHSINLLDFNTKKRMFSYLISNFVFLLMRVYIHNTCLHVLRILILTQLKKCKNRLISYLCIPTYEWMCVLIHHANAHGKNG